MPSKCTHKCRVCSRNYTSKPNLLRHIRNKHKSCNILGLIFKCSTCDDLFKSMENFQSHCSVNMELGNNRNNQQFENISSVGTPVNDEKQTSTLPEDNWAQFRPLNMPTASSASSTATTVIYSDLEEYIKSNTELETLPEPATKKIKISDVEDNKNLILEKLELVDSKLDKLERKLDQLQSHVENQIASTSVCQQHYSRSLAGVLQKDIGSLKEMLRNSSTKDIIQSIVSFNNSLLKAVQVDKTQEGSQ